MTICMQRFKVDAKPKLMSGFCAVCVRLNILSGVSLAMKPSACGGGDIPTIKMPRTALHRKPERMLGRFGDFVYYSCMRTVGGKRHFRCSRFMTVHDRALFTLVARTRLHA